ncbi:MAG: DUF255 domain-containing protein [Bacteroidia bacterium]|nr:DUF255 domain-containing protein [Bacteroidia bacterium]
MKNLKITIVALVFMLVCFEADAQKSIYFEKGSWAEIIDKAKEQDKLVFVDFYTQWCGPCLTMAQEVFVLPMIYGFYNDNFINAKIDAENGEGIDLAARYTVNSYPTYLFIDPFTQEVVHRSSSRQDADVFLFTGESALDPKLRSFYLESNYEKEKGDLEFLNNYIKYKNSVYDRNAITKVLSHLESMEIGLDNEMAWNLFYNNINGYDNQFFNEVADDYTKYVGLYGKEVVDSKIAKESSYAPLEILNSLPDFDGKQTNIAINTLGKLTRDNDYEQAIVFIDSCLEAGSLDKQKFLQSLRFVVRLSDYKEYPQIWVDKCGEYLRYIAYNFPDRQDAYIHFEYAQYLEKLLKNMSKSQEGLQSQDASRSKGHFDIPLALTKDPILGKPTYTMRPDQLKAKPVRK